MSKLTKSLSDLDAMADELLSKSEAKANEIVEDEQDENLEKSEAKKGEENEDLNPDEVSENVPEDTVQETDDTEDKKDGKEEEEPAEDEEEEKVEKSMKSEEDEEAEEPEEELEKGDDADGDLTKSEDAEEEDEEEEPEVDKEKIEKSLKNEFEGVEEIKKSIDASEFLSAVTEVLAKSMADLVYNLQSSNQVNTDSDNVLAKSLRASLELNKSMNEELENVKAQNEALTKSIQNGFEDIKGYISEQMEEMSHQPATVRKSLGSVSVQDKSFQKSMGSFGAEENLSKSEVLAKLNNLMYSGNPIVTPTDIISYESGAPLRQEVAQLVQGR